MLTLDGITQFIENRQRSSYIGSTKIHLFDSNFFEKIYHYLFTPSLINYKKDSLIFLMMSFENTFLLMIILIMFTKIIINISQSKLRIKDILEFENLFILLISLTLLIVLSHTTFNSGIATRQKYIFLPLILYLMFKLSNIKKYDNL